MRVRNLWWTAATLALIPTMAAAQVEGDLRLANGDGPHNGRVEVFHSGQWGTVCDDLWFETPGDSAAVACRQAGFPTGVPSGTTARYGEGVDPIWMDNVNCSGAESRLVDCPFLGFGSHNCVHAEDAGVHCSGCPASPATCTGGFGKATLSINDKKPGKERMSLRMVKGPALAISDMGLPLDVPFLSHLVDSPSYSVCVYDDADALVGQMRVAADPDEVCKNKLCWKSIAAGNGYLYKDANLQDDGIQTVKMKAGAAGKSSIVIKGRNNSTLGLNNLPTMAAGLAGATSATVQVYTDESRCFEASLNDVKRADGLTFKATN